MEPGQDYRIKIDQIFEGPMDLLVYLIKKHEIDIYHIPIALITQKYLQYLNWIKFLNIDHVGEFMLMASTLAQIKSKMLLPVHEDDNEENDPRLEIVRPLEEYLKIKSAAQMLGKRDLLGEDTFIRQPLPEETAIKDEPEMIKVGLFELIDAFQKILENMSSDNLVDITADTVSVKDRITQIVDVFENRDSITFDELFSDKTTKSEIVVTFLAILEMVRLNLLNIVQHAQTGIIRLFYL